jgi:hypothetical protein
LIPKPILAEARQAIRSRRVFVCERLTLNSLDNAANFSYIEVKQRAGIKLWLMRWLGHDITIGEYSRERRFAEDAIRLP